MSDNGNNQSGESRVERILRHTDRRPRPSAAVSAEVKAVVREAWKTELDKDKAGRTRADLRGLLALAASILVIVAVGVYRFSGTPEPAIASVDKTIDQVEYFSEATWKPLRENMRIGPGRLRTTDSLASITLSSGTNVRLATGSRVNLHSVDELSLEQGAVYVDSGSGHSLRIKTRYGLARDIGTRFLVDVDDRGWQVQVRDGLVAVADDGLSMRARPGERIRIAADNSIEKVSLPAHHPSWSWAQRLAKPIAIEGLPLAAYLDWYARETGRQVKFQNQNTRQAAERTILHGSIDGLQPAESLAIVLSSTALTYTRNNGEVVISRQQ